MILSFINVPLTACLGVVLAVLVVYNLRANLQMKAVFRENRVRISNVNSRLEDSLSGVRVVKSFAAEDVMQETFLQVWKSAPTYRPGGKNALTWILGITKYTALARLREGQRAGVPLEDAADQTDPRDAFRDCENRIVTQAMLAQLAQDEREIVVLHVVTGLKHREIAELLEMPLPTVLSKYRRSLKKLERLVREPS